MLVRGEKIREREKDSSLENVTKNAEGGLAEGRSILASADVFLLCFGF
jgi:hypothetical protein